jgi:hypothetical protein
MDETIENYKHWFTQRKAELTNVIFERTNGIIVNGPFKGMKILPKGVWGDGHPAAKLLGLYESELYPVVELAIENKPDLILNVGCAEGFYGLGLALRTGVPTLLVDPWSTVLDIARENAKANNINNVLFSTDSSINNFQFYITNAKKPLLVIDCEGSELDILDLDAFPELSKTTILVETHDCVKPGIMQTLVDQFANTHSIDIIPQGEKNPHLNLIKDLSDYDKLILCCEERPSTMFWLYMVPK